MRVDGGRCEGSRIFRGPVCGCYGEGSIENLGPWDEEGGGRVVGGDDGWAGRREEEWKRVRKRRLSGRGEEWCVVGGGGCCLHDSTALIQTKVRTDSKSSNSIEDSHTYIITPLPPFLPSHTTKRLESRIER